MTPEECADKILQNINLITGFDGARRTVGSEFVAVSETYKSAEQLRAEIIAALAEREREIARLRDCLSQTQGTLHNINYEAIMIHRWADDPNCKVRDRASHIAALRLEAHQRITTALSPTGESGKDSHG